MVVVDRLIKEKRLTLELAQSLKLKNQLIEQLAGECGKLGDEYFKIDNINEARECYMRAEELYENIDFKSTAKEYRRRRNEFC